MSYLDLFKDTPPAENDVSPVTPVVFAATDMTVITISDSRASDDSVILNAKQYYRLTPKYWAWFNHKYHLMEQALTRKKITEADFTEILDRISKLYNLAFAAFGKDALRNAEQTTDVKLIDEFVRQDMKPASSVNQTPSLVFERGNEKKCASRPDSSPAASRAENKVAAIRALALALGWTPEQLFRTDGIAYRDWGLVKFIGADDEIGEVTRESIEIVNRKNGKATRFYNNDVDQPWCRHAEKDAKQ